MNQEQEKSPIEELEAEELGMVVFDGKIETENQEEEKPKERPIKRIIYEFEIALTQDELIQRGEELVKASLKVEDLEAEKSRYAARYKSLIDDGKKELQAIRKIVSEKKETKSEWVEVKIDFYNFKKLFIWEGVVVGSTHLTPAERQVEIDFMNGK